jgi:hypothetical protein
MANIGVGAWRHSDVRSQSHSNTSSFSDDGLDFPPTLHPVRELITFSIFVSGIIAFIIWGGFKLL